MAEKREVKFAPEILEKLTKENDAAGGDTIRMAPMNPTPEQVVNAKKESYVEARMVDDVEPERPRSRFAPKREDFQLLSGGSCLVRRIGLAEEAMFRSLAQTVVQYAPYVQALNMRGVASMYQSISATVTNVVKACVEGTDVGSLPLCDKLALFYKIIEMTYGAKHVFVTDDDGEVEVDLSALRVVRPKPGDLEKRVSLAKSFGDGAFAIVTPPTIDGEDVFYSDDVTGQMEAVIDRMVVDGEDVTADEFRHAIEAMHPDDVNAIESAVKKFGEYGIDVEVAVVDGGGKKRRKTSETKVFKVTLEAIITNVVNKVNKA